jgi:hypothetical protein
MLASIDVRESRNQHRAGMRRHVQTIGDKCGLGGGLRGGARRYAETGIERSAEGYERSRRGVFPLARSLSAQRGERPEPHL